MNAERELSEAEVLTDEVRAWIGRTTGPLEMPEEVSAADVRQFVEATGDTNPLWLDDGAARAAGYRARVVPPMMVVTLSWRLKDGGRLQHDVPLPEIYSDTRNAELEIDWLAPVYVGDRLVLQHRLTDIRARRGKRGLGVYITRETEYRTIADQCVVVRSRQTIVKLPRSKVAG
jgi:acyl dehydratase